MGRFEGRVALVTGAAGGIGAAVVARLADEGASVVATDLTDDGLAGQPGVALGVAGDVRDPASAAAVVAAATEQFGRLDVLVNVAGVGGFKRTEELTLDDWERTIGINLTGTFVMSQAALTPLLAQKGNIVNLASVAGIRAIPYNAAYCASKGGVIMLTKAMAVEYGGAGLRVNCVCPSSVATPFLEQFTIPDGADFSLLTRGGSVIPRASTPEEVASAVAYLASDEATMVTGTSMVMDGGATA